MYITPNNMFSLSPIKRKKFIAYYIPSLFGIGILNVLARLEGNMSPILIILFFRFVICNYSVFYIIVFRAVLSIFFCILQVFLIFC